MARREFDYDTRKDHETRLRKAFLSSADAIPDQVTAYLRGFEGPGRWRGREQVLRTFVPLTDHLPAEYVTFALKELIADPDEADDVYDPREDFGIGGRMDAFPPAHGQGPFLRLLRTDEAEGLRLVHGLTNAATRSWRRRERGGRSYRPPRTPLPLVLAFESGPREFWGDEVLYCWHRHTSVGPYPVISALMALEVWMEEQLARGRPGGALIGEALAGSESVAVVAVCVGVSLAFPETCLAAALPLLANPRVWRMDAHRFHKDRAGPPIFPDPLGRYEHAYRQLRERNQCPQRRREVSQVVHMALFSEGEDLRAAAAEAFRRFGDDLPFAFEEERTSEPVVRAWREEVNGYREFLKPENYRREQTPEGDVLVFRSPRRPSAADVERANAAIQFLRWAELDAWASRVQESASPPDESESARIVHSARSFHREGDFAEPPGRGPDTDPTRQQSIAAVAAAVACRAWAWAGEHGHADWCLRVLLAAARCPRDAEAGWDRETVFPLDHKLSAARGLTALVARGVSDLEVRGTVLGLVLDSQMQVVRALFAGLRDVWGRDDCLCRNCLSLAVTLSAGLPGRATRGRGPMPDDVGDAWLDHVWERHASGLAAGEIPPLPGVAIGNDPHFLWDLAAAALHALPLAELVREPATRADLLRLHDGLLAWTIGRRRGEDDAEHGLDAPSAWTNFFMGWVAGLARHLTPDETDRHILSAVRSAGAGLPAVAGELLYGCLDRLIGSLEPPDAGAERAWEGVCGLVLDAPGLTRYADEDYLPTGWSPAVTRVVFVSFGMYLFRPEWSHAPRFARVIEKWVGAVGTNHTAYSALLTMLKVTGFRFPVTTVLGWLGRIASQSSDTGALWRSNDNGRRTAEVLYSVWERSRAELYADSTAFRQFADLIDRLAARGVALAGVIQSQLEEPAGE